ncbi:hypothetical protein 268TH004_52 [Bacillus phage 268TH004]|uniref:Uncharacterized protein n=1 Tax=Bacillus phage 268TH004 TaxID=2801523 RepID=A0A7T8C2E6_9CAUD|nr:hypothetical protein 268TH004_52 [Bacillus phage 268TH004]
MIVLIWIAFVISIVIGLVSVSAALSSKADTWEFVLGTVFAGSMTVVAVVLGTILKTGGFTL